MQKITAALLMSTAFGLAMPAMAAGFGHQHDVTLAGQNLPVNETSARVLGNDDGQVALVDDITDGLGKTKIPGFKIMVMSRASSLNYLARQNKDGSWRDDRAVHHGSKITFGVPVVNGQPDLSKAILLDMALIADKPDAAEFKAEDKVRPRGQQLLKKDTKVGKSSLKVLRLEMPDLASGEQSGGGVQLVATTVLDGKPVSTVINSTFQLVDVAKPAMSRMFNADPRFVKKGK